MGRGTLGRATTMKKLRLRYEGATSVLNLDTSASSGLADTSTIFALKQKIRNIPSCLSWVPQSFELSLNSKDGLSDDLSLKEAGVRSGDLLHVLVEKKEEEQRSRQGQRGATVNSSHVPLSLALWLESRLVGFGFEKDKNARDQSEARSTYTLRRRNREVFATAEVVISEIGGSRYQFVYATVLNYKLAGVYKACVKAFDPKSETTQRHLVDAVVLPVTRDAALAAGFEPPPLFDTMASSEVVHTILQTLDYKSLGKLCCVSTQWLRTASENTLWNLLYKQEFGYSLTDHMGANSSCKTLYINEKKKRETEKNKTLKKHSKWMNFGYDRYAGRFEPHDDYSFPGREAFLASPGIGSGRGSRNRRMNDRFRLV